ncbi:MAG: DUF484 family protein [Proteobacteria bacterium]|nr:DUF484 family protein [Pseudomonadota bacterium]
MSKIESASKETKEGVVGDNEATTLEEQALANDLQMISLLRNSPDFFLRHPELLAIIDVSHDSGRAVSLIERQVAVLRQQSKEQDQRLRELMDVARDNERLAKTRHSLSLNLLSAHDLQEVINIVHDTLRDELSADYVVVKLFSDDGKRVEQLPELFVNSQDENLNIFKTMLQQKNTVCGNASAEQKAFLFDSDAENVKSAAIIPLVAGANLGVIGLGAADGERFKSSMGTDFLAQTGELISASLAIQLEK